MKKKEINAILHSSWLKKLLLTMKLTIVLFLIGLMQVSATVYSQSTKFNFKLEEKQVADVLKEIEENSNFRFFYLREQVDVERKVTVKVRNATVEEILEELFENEEINYRVMEDNLVLLSPEDISSAEAKLLQQQTSISGTVTDEDGLLLPGVTVIIKGTTNGTVTNADGNYTLSNVPADATLVFSFVGMKTQEIEVGNKTIIDVSLVSAIKDIDEVVIVGYGTQKKSHLTAAIEQVGNEVLVNRPVNTVNEAVQGAVAGLYVTPTNGAPGTDASLNIRGFTGFNSKGSPLVLVDGVERPMSDVNPNDVESITVLKDAAASAIYGSRAPSGVILITTKSGGKGERIRVNYSGSYNIGSPIGMPEWAPSYEYTEKLNEYYRNMSQSPLFKEETIQRMRDYAAGIIDENNIVLPNGKYGAHWDMSGNSNWFDILFKKQIPSQQHNVSFSGGSENTSYYMGLGYNQSEGIIIGTDDKKDRYTALLKVNTDATDWLSLNLSMNYLKSDEVAPNMRGRGADYTDIWANAAATLPSWVDINPNGSPSWLSSGPTVRGEGGTVSNDRNETTLTGGFTFKPFKGFSLKSNYTWRNYTRHFNKITLPIYVTEADGIERASGRAAKQSQVDRTMDLRNYHTFDVVGQYSKQIKKHSVMALAGYQQEYNNFTRLVGSNKDLYTASVPVIRATYNENPTVRDELSHWATQGIFGRFAYNFAEKYFIEFNGRYDAHSKFPEDIRWSFFPSVSGAWNVAKENFWTFEQITTLKLRGAYTSSGNPGSGNYLYLPTMGTGLGNGDVLLGGSKPNMVFMPSLVSPDLTWAKPKTLGIGLDIVALKNRLDVTCDWYQRTIYDQAGPAKLLPKTIGTGLPSVNVSIQDYRKQLPI